MNKSDFFQDVYEVTRLVPKGRVTTYGAIAKYLGSPTSSRLVGWAMNASHKIKDIPAHRVVNRNGLLTGKMHFQTISTMEELLIQEGVSVINDSVVDFKNIFWDPTLELNI